jgi:hypothetical protein
MADNENKALAKLPLVQETEADESHMNVKNKGKGTIFI